ncbi:unnamed protein product, partial [Meganyctiphanes norvegica]
METGVEVPRVPPVGGVVGAGAGYWAQLREAPPPVPPQLLKKLACKDRHPSSSGKVKVLLKVQSSHETSKSSEIFTVDNRKKTITLFDPGVTTPGQGSKPGVNAPKMFSFDGIFTQEESQTELCSAALTDVIVAVLRGTDGSIFSFGQPNLGQHETMLGSGPGSYEMGIMPCGLWWLYKALEDHKMSTGSRFSVRVSALQITLDDQVTDLLAPYAHGEQSPGMYLMEQSTSSSSLLALATEVRAPNVERAAQLLEAALRSRQVDEQGRPAHLLFSLNIYQYFVDTSAKGGVSGGRSRLHMLDFGALERQGKTGHSRLNHTALGNVILAICNGQKHLPYKDEKLPRLLKECCGSLLCMTSMVVHVAPQNYQETLATAQVASRIHRLRRKHIKPAVGGSGSGGSSEESRSGRSSKGTVTDTGSSSVDPSSSEQSCDTVIYVGPGNDDATDGEHPPVYLPNINSGDNRCSMKKALRGSSVDYSSKPKDSPKASKKSAKENVTSKNVSKSPKHSSSKDGAYASPHKSKEHHKPRESGVGVPGVISGETSSPRTPNKYYSPGAKLSSGATPKSPKSPHVSRHTRHKSAAPITSETGANEQWIDGPRFSKSKVYDGQKIISYEMETWIDGPEATYGVLDDNKKSMIQKWVETQNTTDSPKRHSQRSPKHQQYKEMTQFKSVDDTELSPKHKSKHSEKRRSSELKEIYKDKHKEEGTPQKHRSYGDRIPTNKAPCELSDDRLRNTNKVSENCDQSAKNETKECLQSKQTKVTSPVKETAEISVGFLNNKLPQTNVDLTVVNSSSDLVSSDLKQSHINSNVHPIQTTQSEMGKVVGEICDVRLHCENTALEEEEEVLQVTYVDNTAKIIQTVPTAGPEDTASMSSDGCTAMNEADMLEAELQDDVSQVSSEDSVSLLSHDAMMLQRKAHFFLREVRGLDEDQEELEAALDRWLADDGREYITVEEPQEPPEMVDSWCQVTEEDIERTLAEAGIISVPFMQHCHLLPPVQEEPGETAERFDLFGEEANETQYNAKQYIFLTVCKKIMKINFGDVNDAEVHQNVAEKEVIGYNGSSRYEQMIENPNFTAKTQYFAKRLEELQQLHEFYRNLAKQAPRGRSSFHELSEDDSSVSEISEDMDVKALPAPLFSQEGALSSLKLGGEYEFDWKSLLPEEIDAQSETNEKAETLEEDTASELSKDVNDPLFDIQSDIMPYLPSNYVSLTSFTPLRKRGVGSSNPDLKDNDRVLEPPKETVVEVDPIDIMVLQERLPGNGASLSDDESNVKHVKVKKEKRKNKFSPFSRSSKEEVTKCDTDGDEGKITRKLSWSRLFWSPKHKPSKSSSKKKSKSSPKSSDKSGNSSGKNSDKSSKKSHRDRDQSKENISNKEREKNHSKENLENVKLTNIKGSETFQKYESDCSNGSSKNKSPSKKSSDRRSSKSSRYSSPQTFEASLPPFLPVTAVSTHARYDSGVDSCVGLKVVTRSRQSRNESHRGESSGYESLFRDSECSSFGSSQDSGLEDNGHRDGRKDKHDIQGSEKIDDKTILMETSSKIRDLKQDSPSKRHSKGHRDSKSSSSASPISHLHSHSKQQKTKSPSSSPTLYQKPSETHHNISSKPSTGLSVEEYNDEDVARFDRRKTDEDIAKCRRTQEKIHALREKQNDLKKELEAAKSRLNIDKSRWNFELHVEECMTWRDEGYMEALQQETHILQKRVMAAKSRVLVATCFDGTSASGDKKVADAAS